MGIDDQRLVAINIGTSKIVLSVADPKSVRASEKLIDPYVPQDWISKLRLLADELQLVETKHLETHLTVCGTSGSFVLVDAHLNIIGDVSLYNESYPDFVDRSVASLDAHDLIHLHQYIQPNSSFLKLVRHYTHLNEIDKISVRHVLPQSVWLLYKLLIDAAHDVLGISSDVQNCRKLGAISSQRSWPLAAYAKFGVPSYIFTKIVDAGTHLGSATSSLSASLGLSGAHVYHGTTDASAEGLFLTGCNDGSVGVIAGSTTSIKAVVSAAFIESPFAYFAQHPVEPHLSSYTSWITGGELIRRLALSMGIATNIVVQGAWTIHDSDTIPIFPLTQTPIIIPDNLDANLAARGVIESITYWEALELEHIKSQINILTPIRFMGGTTKSDKWMRLRAAAIGEAIEIYDNVGALGALVPALKKLGWLVKDFPQFLNLNGRVIQPSYLTEMEINRKIQAKRLFYRNITQEIK